MDMLAVDLTRLKMLVLGARVILWGNELPYKEEVAKSAGTISYEIVLCFILKG